MPRKLRFSVRKTHSHVKNGDLDPCTSSTLPADVTTVELCTTGTQTDSICMNEDGMIDHEVQTDIVDVCTTEVQTDVVELCTTAVQTEDSQASRTQNLLTPVPNSLVVSVPLQYFYMVKLESVGQLSKCLSSIKCIHDWYFSGELEPSHIKLVKITEKIVINFEITPNMHWSVCFPSTHIGCDLPKFKALPSAITCISDLQKILMFLNQQKLCLGISDPQFAPVTSKCKGVFLDKSGKMVAYFDNQFLTIRHCSCEWLLSESSADTCSTCSSYKKSYLYSKLRSLTNQTQSKLDAACAVTSHVNYRYLDTPQKLQRMKNMHATIVKQKSQIKSLKDKMRQQFHTKSIVVDSELSNDLEQLISTYEKDATKDKSDESFHKIFWAQQMKALSVKSKSQIRWHPLIIRWALYLHHRSSGAYETLRKSNVIALPSSRTLRDYRHLSSSSTPGFSVVADVQLLDLIKCAKPNHLAKYVIILIDEVYLKEGLVYNKSTGAMVGFADLGSTLQQLNDYEDRLSTGTNARPLAKTMMVFMVRGVFCNINFPYAQFPMSSAKAHDVFPLLWQTIDRLELNSIHVLGITGDGASVNRKVFQMHGSTPRVHKCINIYSTDQESRQIYFFSDPPHLLKTIRNALASKSRRLWCMGQEISWQHVDQLYQRNLGCNTNCGVSMVHKLTLEHINLTSFSKMRVDLAAQVMSETVSKALLLTGGSEAFETSLFIGKVDKFFDTLNVTSYTKGIKSRKPFQKAYFDENDSRLEFLTNFLAYLNAWEKSVETRKGFTNAEKKMMVLPKETQDGIHITVSSFVEFLPYLFSITGVTSFLSARINQDPIEKFFGMQRQAGRAHQNPTAAEFLKNTETFRTISAIWIDDIVGNCRGRRSNDTNLHVAMQPLRKRKRSRPRRNSD